MTVTSDVQSVVSRTDGSTVNFPIPFYFLRETDIVVDRIDADGNLVELVLGTDYTVSGAGNQAGGSYTTTETFEDGYDLHCYRVVPATQESQYQQNDPFPAKTTEKALDKLTMLFQQAQQTLDRALVVPRSDLNPQTTLPPARQRANKGLGFDNNGNPFAIDLKIGSVPAPVVNSISMLRLVSKAIATAVFVLAYYPGGNGGGAFAKAYDVAPEGWENGGTQIVAADGAGWELQHLGHVSLHEFGAKGDGANDDSPYILNWLNYLIASGNTGYVSGGAYHMATPLSVDVTGSLDVRASDNAVFVGAPGISQNMILLLATAATSEQYRVSWRGGSFDISQMEYVPAALSGSGLALQWVWNCVVDGVQFNGPADYTQGGSAGGDSGLSVISCQFVSVMDCHFNGIRDTGVYVTGDSSTADNENDGRDIVITGCHFNKCAAGVSVKRQFQRVLIGNNIFYYCLVGAGVVTTDVVRPDPPAGGRVHIIGNSFAYCGKNAIDIRYSNVSGTMVVGNRIQDFGYALDGVTPVANPTAILLEGASQSFIQGNWIGMQDWVRGGSHCAVLMQAFTYAGVTYQSKYNTCLGNNLIGLDIGFRETPGQADYNIYNLNPCVDVVQKYNNIQSNSTMFDQDSGTWAVVLYDTASAGNASPTTATGYYVKTGKVVTVSFSLNDINTAGMTAANPIYIGLPFPANAAAGAAGSITLDSVAFPAGRTSIALTLPPGQTRALISASGSGVSDSTVTVGNITSGTSDIVQATLTYPTVS